jgi:small-conductance mechanosensitive channel
VITVGDILTFALTVWAAALLARFTRFVLEGDVLARLDTQRGVAHAVARTAQYAVLLVGFFAAAAAAGIDMSRFTVIAGALGVGIGFGLQGLVNNFVSGLVILSERRINVGDAVQIGDVGGQVQQLGIRACMVRTWEGAEVIVPNASLVNEKVANWTLSDRLRRIDWAVNVAYGTPPEKVVDILLGVARAHVYVLGDPAPMVLFQGVGDSALRFELRVWTDRFDAWPMTRSELAVAGYAALRDAAIEIPFPQQEVHLRYPRTD